MARILSGNNEPNGIVTWRKDELLSRLSALCGLILLAVLTSDIVQYAFGQPLYTTQEFTYITLVLHVMSFLMSVLAFVYTTSRHKRRTDKISTLLIVFNGLIFLLRIVLELTFINFRREYYNS